MGLIILYFTAALALSFLCSVLEAVLLSTPISFISMKENQGNKTASLMKRYKNNVDRPVGAILSLNTIAHTIGSAGVGAESKIWEKMLEKREHISIILDEYGCLRGVVSMEDVIETMTGVEIVDEDDVAVDMQAFAKEKSRRMLRK